MKLRRTYKEAINLPLKGYFKNYYEFKNYKDFINYLLTRYNGKEYILGKGSNTLPIRKCCKRKVLRVDDEIILIKGERAIISGSTSSSKANTVLKKLGYTNFIGPYTIPGTIGAGIKNNASFLGYDYYEGLESIIVFDGKNFLKIDSSRINRCYRKTDIKGIILFAIYKLKKGYAENIEKKVLEKRKSQPKGIYTLGSTFKNPMNYHAYELVEKVLEKHPKMKSFMSKEHYNFLDISAEDDPKSIYKFIKRIKRMVKREFGVSLELEIRIIK